MEMRSFRGCRRDPAITISNIPVNDKAIQIDAAQINAVLNAVNKEMPI
jgi:hypothetical protein